MIDRFRKHSISIKNALNGILWAYKTQPNYQVHVVLSIIVVAAGVFFNIQMFEWLVLVLTISTGLVIETINTSIESATDAITREWKDEIRIAKDTAAAAMLTHAVGSLIIAGIIFIPKML